MMKRVLVWLLALALCWEAFVYWHWRQKKLARGAPVVKQSKEPLPDADDVIDAIRYFLQEKRRRAP